MRSFPEETVFPPALLKRAVIDQTKMQIDNRLVSLAPGMATTIEIKTGSRRLIEYLMSPMLRYKQESMRER